MDGFDAIIRAGQALGDPRAVPGGAVPYAIVPEGAIVENLELLMPAPARARASARANSAETFIAYVSRFKTDASVIFADQTQFSVIGILDYHQPDRPAFGEHRVVYSAPRSLEWQTWRASSGKRMKQSDFAQFIEDNVVDIRSPAGADVLEMARGLQAKKSVQFVSAIRLSDGAREFTYNETVDGTTVKGKIKTVEEFTLGIPVFFGDAPHEVHARLRYRIDDGSLSMWYELYRPEYIEQGAFREVCGGIAAGTGIQVWEGAP